MWFQGRCIEELTMPVQHGKTIRNQQSQWITSLLRRSFPRQRPTLQAAARTIADPVPVQQS
jgi:hypothetical protein